MSILSGANYVMSLNLTSLRDLHPRQLAQQFRQLLAKSSENTISAQLLAEVDGGSLPATVVSVWLSVCKTPVAVADALLQSHSILARRFAIVRLGKALRNPQWRNLWDHLGGTEGLLSLFAELSVQDVKLLAKAIGRYSKSQKDEEKQQQVTELLRGLLGSLYPSTPYKTQDERPLQCHYANIVPACSPEFVRELLCQESSPVLGCFSVDRLLQRHYGTVRQLVVNAIINGDGKPYKLPQLLQSLLRRMPPIPSIQPRWSASMCFSLTLLRELSTQEDTEFPSELFLPQLVEPLMRRAVRKRLAWTDLQEISELTITYLKKNPNAAGYLSASRRGFIHHIARCWSWNPEMFEDLLIIALRLRRHDKRSDIDQYHDLIRLVPRSKRYTLLRLLISRTESLGADISVEDELKTLRLEKWPCKLFTEIWKDQAVSLLRALTHVKPEGSFLRLERGSTVLATAALPGADHPDPALLLTLLERGQTGALERAKKGKSLAVLTRLT